MKTSGTVFLAALVLSSILVVGAGTGALGAALVDLGTGTSTGVTTDGSVVAVNPASGGGAIWSVANGLVSIGAGTTGGVAIKGGQVVVGGVNGGNASRWDGSVAGVGAWTQLPLPGGTAWTILCTSASDSANNVWFGGYSGSTTGSRNACRYKQSSNSSTNLQLPAGGNKDSYIYGISDTGHYAGRCQYGATSPGGSRQAMGSSPFVTALTFLDPLIGPHSTSNEGVANCCSRDGNVAGGWSEAPSYHRQATVWQISFSSSTPVPFVDSDNYSEIQCLNEDGTIGAGYGALESNVSGTKRAVIWELYGGTRDLKTYLAGLGADVTGWTLTDVKGMSGDGTVLTGNGLLNGVAHAWVYHPSATPITKPVVGTTGKSLVDPLMSAAKSGYKFVVWGKVSEIDAGSPSAWLKIDDGSGVVIKVSCSGHGQSVNSFVRVAGTVTTVGNPAEMTCVASDIQWLAALP